MPPKKSAKDIEPTDRTTRSKTLDRPAPNYHYSSEEESFSGENFNPNIDLTSTGILPKLPAHLIRPVQRRSYSPTEFDLTPASTSTSTLHLLLLYIYFNILEGLHSTYWTMSVSFLYKSVIMPSSAIVIFRSRKLVDLSAKINHN